jgi:hypothetical protein
MGKVEGIPVTGLATFRTMGYGVEAQVTKTMETTRATVMIYQLYIECSRSLK